MEKPKCRWHESWIGQCKEFADNSGFCEKHKNQVCCSCGAIATHSCEETGQFVCGFLLCDECTHMTFPDGTNGGVGFNEQQVPEGMKRHIKKINQKHSPWYAREEKTCIREIDAC